MLAELWRSADSASGFETVGGQPAQFGRRNGIVTNSGEILLSQMQSRE